MCSENALVLIMIKTKGRVGTIEAADAMSKAAPEERVGRLISVHVIPRPHEDLDRAAGDGGAPVGGKPAAGAMPVAVDPDDLLAMKVVELRKAARKVKDFPLQGRLLARSNRDEILDGFRELGLL